MKTFKEHFTEAAKNPHIKAGDTILVGKWRNSPAVVKGFGKDKNNQPTVKTNRGPYSLYKFRIQKLMKEAINALPVNSTLPEIIWTTSKEWKQEYIYYKQADNTYALAYIYARKKWWKREIRNDTTRMPYSDILDDDDVIKKEYTSTNDFLEDWITDGGGLDI